MRRIYLIRHGEPASPTGERVCLSCTDLPLNQQGREQGEALQAYFANIPLAGVYSSDLLRAKETARFLTPQVTAAPELRELGVGCWEGLSFREIRERYAEEYALRGENPAEYVMSGGERPADCRDRALNALLRILAETEGDIAVVAHAGVNRLILCDLLGLELREFLTIPQPYGCINCLREDGGVLVAETVGLVPKPI